VSSTEVVVTGLNTAAMPSSGLFAYASAPNVATPTDAASAATGRTIGAYEGVPGQTVCDGAIVDAQFTTAGGAPTVDQAVWLALAASEAGAAGKLTASLAGFVPGDVVAEVGICLDPTNYAALKTSRVLIAVQQIIQL